MKKYLILAAAAVAAMAACTKNDVAVTPQREINFEVANSVQTKASGSVYSNGAFGTYAWFNGTDQFMINETVDKVGGVWKTSVNTFYWPKTGSIDFISYSPFAGTNGTAGTVPTVTSSTISYSGVTAGATDIMYADKVTCASNVNEVTDSDSADSGFKGVPTVFHHALAKLSFKIKANFLEYTDATTSTTTKWEVTVTSAQISGFKTTGDCALTWDSTNKVWTKPVTSVGSVDYNVWTNLSGATAAQELVDNTTYPTGVKLTTTAQDLNAASGFVIPQVLDADAQKLTLTIHIKTTLSNSLTIEEDLTKTVDIKDISTLAAWQMNENIVYTINIKPTASDATNPHNDDPEDVIITFDPAVADWTTVDTSATIQI